MLHDKPILGSHLVRKKEKELAMKRSLLYLPTIVLFGSMALAQNQNQNQNQNGKPRVTATEAGAVGMLALSSGAIGAGLVFKRRRKP